MSELLTILAVSVDAYFAGFSYALSARPTTKSVICVWLTTFGCSLLALVLSNVLSQFSLFFRVMGCVVFVGLGVRNLRVKKPSSVPASVLFLSLGVSADAALACLSLSPPLIQILPLAFLIALFHALFLVIGYFCAKFVNSARWLSVISGVWLIVVGIKKLW